MSGVEPVIVTHNIVYELKGAVSRVSQFSEGWVALHLLTPHFNKEDWSTQGALSLLRNMFLNTPMHLEECHIFFLCNNTILILCRSSKVLDVKYLVRNMVILFSSDKSKTQESSKYTIFSLNQVEQLDKFKLFIEQILIQEEKYEKHPDVKHEYVLNLEPSDFEKRQKRDGLCVLIIEDDEITARLLKYILEKHAKVVHAENAKKAQAMHVQHMPDIIFLDIGLPDINGLELLKRMKKSDEGVYVVMLTANSFAENVKTAISCGAKGFVAKPFSAQKIMPHIEKYKSEKKKVL